MTADPVFVAEQLAGPGFGPLVAPRRRVLLVRIGWCLAFCALGLDESRSSVPDLTVFGVASAWTFWMEWRRFRRVVGTRLSELPAGSVVEGLLRSALRTLAGVAALLVGVIPGVFLPLVGGLAGGIALGWAMISAYGLWRLARDEREGGWRLLCTVPPWGHVFARPYRISCYRGLPPSTSGSRR